MFISINTNSYEFSHLRKPRGIGNWWFLINGKEYQFFGTYTVAKKMAIEVAKALGVSEIKVIA